MKSWRPLMAALISVCLWASAFVGIRAAGRSITPGSLALGRLAIGAVVLGIVLLRRAWARPTRREIVLLGVAGLLWFGVYNVALNTAEQSLDAGTASMIVNLAPLFVMALAGLFLGERITLGLAMGGVVAFAGVVLIGLSSAAGHTPLSGVLLCLLATAASAAGLVAQKPVLGGLSALQVTWSCCLIGTLCCLGYAPDLVRDLRHAPPGAVAWVAYLGLFPTSVAFTTWAYALARVGASRLATMVYLVPLIAIGISWTLLGETPTGLAILGGVLCLGGVIAARRRSQSTFTPFLRNRDMSMRNDIVLATQSVLGSTMAYREAGEPGAPVSLFLHGNPTSSFIWRNTLPHVAGAAHCIAPDLIGFGQSGKPAIAYRFADHVRYLDEFIARLGIAEAYLVAQDWGTALAFHLAERRPGFVKGLAFMEFIRPMATWAEFHQSDQARELFQKFRTPAIGERLILEENVFIERVVPGSVARQLDPEEMAVYRAPFPTAASRVPIWRFANELPIAGEPADVYDALERAHGALRTERYPKLLFVGDPGAVVSPAFAADFAQTLRNCELINLGSGRHYLQEDHPDTIGRAIAAWIGRQQRNDRETGSAPLNALAKPRVPS